jgi:hypothetical protein
MINSFSELFGYENEDGTEVSGTEELRTYDLGGNSGTTTDSNGNVVYVGAGDGVIDSSDAIFSQLQVWQDLNQDGVSDSTELKSLSDLNISSINLNNLTTLNTNLSGNVIYTAPH